jgi:hypothetical protein
MIILKSLRYLFLTSSLLWENLEFAVCVNGHPIIEEEFEKSTAVFVGRVVSEEFTPQSKDYMEGAT